MLPVRFVNSSSIRPRGSHRRSRSSLITTPELETGCHYYRDVKGDIILMKKKEEQYQAPLPYLPTP